MRRRSIDLRITHDRATPTTAVPHLAGRSGTVDLDDGTTALTGEQGSRGAGEQGSREQGSRGAGESRSPLSRSPFLPYHSELRRRRRRRRRRGTANLTDDGRLSHSPAQSRSVGAISTPLATSTTRPLRAISRWRGPRPGLKLFGGSETPSPSRSIVKRLEIDYRRPIDLEDEVRVWLRVGETRGASFVVRVRGGGKEARLLQLAVTQTRLRRQANRQTGSDRPGGSRDAGDATTVTPPSRPCSCQWRR